MKYRICNLTVEIQDLPIISVRNYDYFRVYDDSEPDCRIESAAVPAIELPKEDCLFQYEHGLYVFSNGETEARYSLNFSTMQIDTVMIDDGKKKTVNYIHYPGKTPMSEMGLFNVLGLEKTFCEHRRVFLHSSFIETDKGAILFTAPSQTGKSTQANLWNQHRGTPVLNGDRAGIWKADTGWMAGGLPWCGTSGISENKNIPLRAIVILKQGPENEVQPIRLVSKIGRLMEQTTINPWNNDMYQKIQELYMDLCQDIPVLLFSCRPDEDAVDTLEAELRKYDEC